MCHATSERRVHVRPRSAVETRVGNSDDLAGALVVSAVDQDIGVNDRPCDVVGQVHFRHLFKMAYFVDRRDIVEVALLHDQMKLVPSDLEVVHVEARRGRYTCLKLARVGVDVDMQYDIDLMRGPRC